MLHCRLYCRTVLIRIVGLDDHFMVAALRIAIGMGVMICFHISIGTGYAEAQKLRSAWISLQILIDFCSRHGSDLNLEEVLIPTLKQWYAYQMVYSWTLFFVKASILALYHPIYKQTNLRFAVYILTAFVLIYTIVAFLVNVSLSYTVNTLSKLSTARYSNAEVTLTSLVAVLSSRLQQSASDIFCNLCDKHHHRSYNSSHTHASIL